MEKEFSYISSIRVDGICGESSLQWDVNRGVNVIAGINGSGKSTILHAVASLLTYDNFRISERKPIKSVNVTFDDGSSVCSLESHSTLKRVDVVSTFDTSAQVLEAMLKLTDNKVRSELDWQLYRVQQRFMRYQIAMGRKAVIQVLDGEGKSAIEKMMEPMNRFYDIIDELFAPSKKSIVRNIEEFRFKYGNIDISPYSLSAGEKQLLVILAMALTQEQQPYIMILDEPDISLHFDWQKRLLSDIATLNPSVQLLASTHSPAVILDGWMDRISDISDLIKIK